MDNNFLIILGILVLCFFMSLLLQKQHKKHHKKHHRENYNNDEVYKGFEDQDGDSINNCVGQTDKKPCSDKYDCSANGPTDCYCMVKCSDDGVNEIFRTTYNCSNPPFGLGNNPSKDTCPPGLGNPYPLSQ